MFGLDLAWGRLLSWRVPDWRAEILCICRHGTILATQLSTALDATLSPAHAENIIWQYRQLAFTPHDLIGTLQPRVRGAFLFLGSI
jgi:hypothetical protein